MAFLNRFATGRCTAAVAQKSLGPIRAYCGPSGISRNPYPHKFHVSTSLPQYVQQYSSLEAGEQLKDTRVSIAGAARGQPPSEHLRNKIASGIRFVYKPGTDNRINTMPHRWHA